MPDYQAIAQKGIRVTEDAIDEEAIFELGAHALRALTATETLTDDDMGTLITNTGAAGAASGRIITLPAPGTGGKPLQFADVGPGMRIAAPATKTIICGNKVTIAGGYIETQFACMFEIWSVSANAFMVKGNPDAFDVETS